MLPLTASVTSTSCLKPFTGRYPLSHNSFRTCETSGGRVREKRGWKELQEREGRMAAREGGMKPREGGMAAREKCGEGIVNRGQRAPITCTDFIGVTNNSIAMKSTRNPSRQLSRFHQQRRYFESAEGARGISAVRLSSSTFVHTPLLCLTDAVLLLSVQNAKRSSGCDCCSHSE